MHSNVVLFKRPKASLCEFKINLADLQTGQSIQFSDSIFSIVFDESVESFNLVPHSRQKLALIGFSEPHLGQNILNPPFYNILQILSLLNDLICVDKLKFSFFLYIKICLI